jgi:hypothetical protein
MATIRDLLVKLGVKVDSGALDKFTKSLQNTKDIAGKLSTAIVGAGVAISGFVASAFALANNTATIGDNFAKAASRIGMTSEELQKLSYAAERSGTNVQAVESAMSGLNRKLAQVQRGTESQIELFDKYGVQLKDTNGEFRSTSDIISSIADTINGYSNATDQAAAATALFGSAGAQLLPMLKGGSTGLEQLKQDAVATGNVMSNKAAADAEVFKDRLLDMQMTISGLKNTFGSALIPVFNDLMLRFKFWFDLNRDFIRENVTKWASNLTKTLENIIDLGSKVVDTFGGMKNTLIALGTITSGFGLLKISPAIITALEWVAGILGGATLGTAAAIVAAIAVAIGEYVALFLLIEDFLVFLKGDGNSVIQEFIEKWIGTDTLFGSIARLLVTVKTLILAIVDAVDGPLSLAFSKLMEIAEPVFKILGDALSKTVDMMGQGLVDGIDKVARALSVFTEIIMMFGDTGEVSIQRIITKVQELINLLPGMQLISDFARQSGMMVGQGISAAADVPSALYNKASTQIQNTVAGSTVNITGVLNQSDIPETVGKITNSIMLNAKAAFEGGDV